MRQIFSQEWPSRKNKTKNTVGDAQARSKTDAQRAGVKPRQARLAAPERRWRLQKGA
jgi:hypothetical protein